MQIACPSCKKTFEVDASLIPSKGRLLQCGYCNKEWFYKKNEIATKDLSSKPSPLIEISKNTENTGNKFFSYLIVFIISFVALIILLDTLKNPLINVFPGLEIILFNLFETLQDIKLFIIDLI